jgi:hypothetical protein
MGVAEACELRGNRSEFFFPVKFRLRGSMARIFLTHVPDMLRNYYGERAVAALRELGELRINDTGRALDAARGQTGRRDPARAPAKTVRRSPGAPQREAVRCRPGVQGPHAWTPD